jgi:putative transcriptional regulator
LEVAKVLRPNYKPLEITLIKKDKTKNDLRNDLKISPTTIAKLAKNEFISLQVLANICEYLNCTIEDVVTFEDAEGI